jgi:hypothetical protein
MRKRFEADVLLFLKNGCVLHLNNLTLMNAYHSTFSFEQMGDCSALRVGYIVSYLMSLEGRLDYWKVRLPCLFVVLPLLLSSVYSS